MAAALRVYNFAGGVRAGEWIKSGIDGNGNGTGSCSRNKNRTNLEI